MATQILILGKHYKARFKNDFLKTSQQNSLAGSSIKKKKLETWIRKWLGWLIEG